MGRNRLKMEDSEKFSLFRERLLRWFDISARELPWRGTEDPYRVWVSEIMLQQTQVETVIPYFERWMRHFPTVTILAAADEATVLKDWEGLGYYRRARMLHRAAQQVVAEFGGVVPLDPRQFARLSGVGRYTTGAVLSISQNIRLPILEANTIRLYARLMALSEDPTTSESQQKLWTFAEQLLPPEFLPPEQEGTESEECHRETRYPYGRLNQSLMELGSLVCTPRTPRCDVCPVAEFCGTYRQGGDATSRIPAAKAKPTVLPVREVAMLIYRRLESNPDFRTLDSSKRGSKITDLASTSEASDGPIVFLVRRRTSRERWSGVWDFPRFPVGELREEVLFDHLRSRFAAVTKTDSVWSETSSIFSSRTGEVETIADLADRLIFDASEPIKMLRHSVTRYRIMLEVYLARISSPTTSRSFISSSIPPIPTDSPGATFPMSTEWSWMTLEQLERLPMHTTARKMTILAATLKRSPS